MAILRVDKLQKSFGVRTLFSDVSFEVQPSEHVGLIGVNGSGKTTLISILLGKDTSDSGTVAIASGARFSSVEQSPRLEENTDLYHLLFRLFKM